MKFVTFQTQSETSPKAGLYFAEVKEILDLQLTLSFVNAEFNLPKDNDFLSWFDLDKPTFQAMISLNQQIVENSAFSAELRTKNLFLPKSSVKLLAPVPRPNKIICIGLNYRDHAIESKMAIPEKPLLFSKFSTSIIGANESILIPNGSEQVDYEAELAVIIGRRAKNVNSSDAMNYVFGYTNFNDVSARDFQFSDGQWQRGKSCDTFAPIGEFIATTDEIPNPHNLNIKLRLNGATMQNSNTNQLIFQIPELIEFISAFITLEPGDIIATGTPPGVGFARKPPIFMKNGDELEVEIEGLGILFNKVRE